MKAKSIHVTLFDEVRDALKDNMVEVLPSSPMLPMGQRSGFQFLNAIKMKLINR
ncbi:MAG TPA: hypothetical protein VK994_06680 [Bacteroidales bacterium]|nr:hypothetical protein [Bacteroidales bacterium]